MSAGHSHHLYLEADSPAHRLAPHVKLVAAILFVLAVVVTPREALVAFSVFALLELVVATIALVPFGLLARRMLIVAPFILFAIFLPFFGGGEKVEVAGLALSREGLWAAWAILAKASLGAGASILLASTTRVPDLLAGLDTLRVPRVITAIAGFMIRYVDVISADLSRSRMAMASRGYAPRWLWQARPLAASAGAMFIRSYERGERVFDAMVARGYSGAMPRLGHAPASARQWALGGIIPLAAWVVTAAALVLA